jgi:hypothetical protein
MDRKEERAAELENDVRQLLAKYNDSSFLVVVMPDDTPDDYVIYGNACGRCAAEKIFHWVIMEKIVHKDPEVEIRH